MQANDPFKFEDKYYSTKAIDRCSKASLEQARLMCYRTVYVH